MIQFSVFSAFQGRTSAIDPFGRQPYSNELQYLEHICGNFAFFLVFQGRTNAFDPFGIAER